MKMESLLNKTIWGAAFLLGQASVLWGVMVALGWSVGFVLIISSKGAMENTLPFRLTVEPPLLGLAMATAALAAAQKSSSPVARYAAAGLIFNAIPLVLALLALHR